MSFMAAGAFVQGSSIELSADGPLREPYAAYFQGWTHMVSCETWNYNEHAENV